MVLLTEAPLAAAGGDFWLVLGEGERLKLGRLMSNVSGLAFVGERRAFSIANRWRRELELSG